MNTDEVRIVVDLIDRVIMNNEDESIINSVKQEVQDLCKSFPIYG
jgi:glycine/serine hydroxymethyltransferase